MSAKSFSRYEQSKASLSSHSNVGFFERYSSPHTHPGGGVWRTLVQKLRTLTIYIIRRVAQGAGRKQSLSALANLAGSAAGRDVLVIGSGPSANAVNAREVAKRQADGSLIVVASNYFLHSPMAKTITPDYLVWSDTVFSPEKKADNRDAWATLEATPAVTVISPWTWQATISTMALKDRFIYFDNDTLEGWSSNISPLRPRGYQGSTGVKSLACALHLGGQQVFLIGLDLSNFQQFRVDQDNRVIRQPVHVKNTDSGVQDITEHTISGIADSLYSTANQFLALRTHFAGRPVINLDPNSLVDAFPKISNHPLVTPTRARKASQSTKKGPSA